MSISLWTFAIALAGAAGVGVAIGWALAARRARVAIYRSERRTDRAESEARTDALTGVWNRKAFDEFVAIQTAIARRYYQPLSLLLLDLDQLKEINDSQGHPAGDAALQHVARALRECCRDSDLVTRLGGDEFAALLPQTDGPGAAVLAGRIRERVGWAVPTTGTRHAPTEVQSSGMAGTAHPTGVSMGIASLEPEQTAADLVVRADRALYRSKQSGRGRIHRDDGQTILDCTPAAAAAAKGS